MKRKRTFFAVVVMTTLILVLLPLGLIVGCSSSSNPTGPNNGGGGSSGGGGGVPGPSEVWIQGFAFNPSNRTIMAGTTITWTNKDNATHTVSSGMPGTPDGIFTSVGLGPGATYSHTFDTRGTFRYYCANHPSMVATVTVQ